MKEKPLKQTQKGGQHTKKCFDTEHNHEELTSNIINNKIRRYFKLC